jgi:hypothetical protein
MKISSSMIIAIVTKHVKNLWETQMDVKRATDKTGNRQNGQPQNGQPQGIAPTGDIQMIICVIWWGI